MRVGIVGGGVIGLAAAEAVTRRGATVTVFERSRPGAGQSGGLTRIFRHLHRTDAQTALAVEARGAWTALEARTGRRLVGPEGVLVAGGDLDAALARLRDAGARAEPVGSGDVARLLGILGPTAPAAAVVDLDGGAIRVRRALACLEGLLPQGTVRQEEVFGVGVSAGGDRARIVASRGSHDFDHVVVAAGAETARLTAGLDIELAEHRGVHPRLTFAATGGMTGLPCYLDRTGTHGETAYAGPVGSTSRYVVGLSADETLPLCATETTLRVDRAAAGLGDLYARTVAYVRRAMPGLDPAPIGFRLCHITALQTDPGPPAADPGPAAADSDAFAAWERGPITVFAGHNVMKFAPLIGELLAGRIVDGEQAASLPRR